MPLVLIDASATAGIQVTALTAQISTNATTIGFVIPMLHVWILLGPMLVLANQATVVMAMSVKILTSVWQRVPAIITWLVLIISGRTSV